MKRETRLYGDGGAAYEAFIAHDERANGPLPCVLVAHHWAGLTEGTRGIALDLAALGYVAVAIDVYGKGRRGTSNEECEALMAPLANDRELLAGRLAMGIAFARSLPMVDPARMGAIGHCFGGLCVLDMARRNLGPQAVVSIHGVLGKGAQDPQGAIDARILVLHGDRDPYAAPDVIALGEELTERGATWELHTYGHAMHAFTSPAAATPELGLAYDPHAARRAWKATTDFLGECLLEQRPAE